MTAEGTLFSGIINTARCDLICAPEKNAYLLTKEGCLHTKKTQ